MFPRLPALVARFRPTPTVSELRKSRDPRIQFLIKELDDARRSAIGYAACCIGEGVCFPEECEDVTDWKHEAKEAGVDIRGADPDDLIFSPEDL